MSLAYRLVLLALAPIVGGCLAESNKGSRDARADAGEVDDDVSADADETDDADGSDDAPDGEADGSVDTAPETASDTSPDTSPSRCGDQLIGPGEACDDGNACPGDGCAGCQLERSLVMTRLELDEGAGFDLDDEDGDHDLRTGRDNRLGSSAAVASALNDYIRDLIESGEVIQLATFTGYDPAIDESPDLVLHPGVDPACGADGTPWLETPFADVHAETLIDCRPPVVIPNVSFPTEPGLIATAPSIVLPLGSLGSFTIARARLEAELRVAADGRYEALAGALGGILPAAALYMIDTSALLPECPTALHAVLGLAGHLDQDANGDGRVDFIRWTTEANTTPCITGPVVISGCCVGGSCDGDDLVTGRDCALDPRVTDGYSVGFRVRAQGVSISGVSDACAP